MCPGRRCGLAQQTLLTSVSPCTPQGHDPRAPPVARGRVRCSGQAGVSDAVVLLGIWRKGFQEPKLWPSPRGHAAWIYVA